MDNVIAVIDGNKKGFGIFALFLGLMYGLHKMYETKDDSDEEEDVYNKSAVSGIVNYGNTCFINSLIQSLASIKSFQSMLTTLVQNKKNTKQFRFVESLLLTIKKINASQGVIDIDQLLQALQQVSPQLSNADQQDAHQFYNVVVKTIEQCQKNILAASLTRTQELSNMAHCLIGYTRSCLQCSKCKNKLKIKVETFYDISLDISSPSIRSLDAALMAYQSLEKIQGVNCIYCSIGAYIQQKKVVLNLVRSKRISEVLERSLEKIIEFLESLELIDREVEDINPIINEFIDREETHLVPVFDGLEDKQIIVDVLSPLNYAKVTMFRKTEICKLPKVMVIHFKRLIMDPYTGDIVLLRKEVMFGQKIGFKLKHSEKIYTLTSLLAHSGNESAGHYYAFRKETKDDQQWFYASDRSVQRCRWAHVVNQKAYMLFYQS